MKEEPPCYLNALGMLCAAGDNAVAVKQRLASANPDCLTVTDAYTPGQPLPLGLCTGELAEIESDEWRWHSRNNRILLTAYEQIRSHVEQALIRFGPGRVGVVLGTSTSGIAETEKSLSVRLNEGQFPPQYHYAQQEMGMPAHFLAKVSGITGPTYGISTACSSSAKAMASGRRLIRMGLCDAVIVGGVDALCRLTVNGFSALESVSSERCNPFSANRCGINIGEGAALFLMSGQESEVMLSGVGEGSDAYHISAPEPQGQGAIRTMATAMEDAGVQVGAIDYINLHGTATPQNDRMEARAVHQLFGDGDVCEVPCSSTKPFTGHCLGAAGAIEAAICYLSLTHEGREGALPPNLWDGERDPELPLLNLVDAPGCSGQRPRHIISNSFAFGGNNISLLLERS